MSLEDALTKHSALLEKNTAVLEKHNELVGKLINVADAKGAAKTDAKGGKAGKGEDAKAAMEAVKAKIAPWLREFAAVEDDPENEARGELLTATLKKLGDYEKIGAIEDADHLKRLDVWIDKQTKAGRIKPEHKAGGADEDI